MVCTKARVSRCVWGLVAAAWPARKRPSDRKLVAAGLIIHDKIRNLPENVAAFPEWLETRKILVRTKAMELCCVWGRQRHVEEGYLELKMDTHCAMRHTSRGLSSKVPSWQQAGRAMGKSLRA